MKSDINLPLRSEILDIALNLEENVNLLLLVLLSIENPKRKAITNKSGNLSFKNKIDLLFDLDVLNNDEHKILLLLMEFRNQFLHNIKCNSFDNAVKLLGADKGNKLLSFDDKDDKQDKERRYNCAYRNLYFESLKIISKKIKDRKKQIKERSESHKKLIESQIYFIDKYHDILIKIAQVCENNVSENPEVIQLINKLSKTVTDDMELAFSSEEFIQVQSKLNELHTPEKIKVYFKR